MNELFLKHHGVKGMKWGEKNGPPYPIDKASKFKQETYEYKTGLRIPAYNFRTSQKANKNAYKAGSKVYHVTRTKDFDLQKIKEIGTDRLYAYSEEYDKSIYEGFFAAWKRHRNTPAYVVEMKLKEDLKLADRHAVSNAITQAAKKNDSFKNDFSEEITNMIDDHSDKPLTAEERITTKDWVYKSIGANNKDSKKVALLFVQYGPYDGGRPYYSVIEELKSKGYNGLIDINDQRQKTGMIGATMPFILIDPLKTAEMVKVRELTENDMVEQMNKLIKD